MQAIGLGEQRRMGHAGAWMVDKYSIYEALKDWILQLPGVTEAQHRFGGTEFRVDGL